MDRVVDGFEPTGQHIVAEMNIDSALVNRRSEVPFLVLIYGPDSNRGKYSTSLAGEELFTRFMNRFGVNDPQNLQGKKVLEVLLRDIDTSKDPHYEGLVPKL